MIQLTETAVTKVNEILNMQDPKPAGLRISVVGGGCSGFSYSMAFENQPNMLDKTYNFGDLRVFVDQAACCISTEPKWTTWRRSKARASSSIIRKLSRPAVAAVRSALNPLPHVETAC